MGKTNLKQKLLFIRFVDGGNQISMKNILFVFVSFALFGFNTQPKPGKDSCNVEIGEIKVIVSLGYLVGYSVEFTNNSDKVIDGLYWTATYTDNGKNIIRKENGAFNSTKNIFPIEASSKRLLNRVPKVKGATKVTIELNKVHYNDDSSCPEEPK
jgi:hypothetical protein